MLASSWAMNGYLEIGGKNDPVCHIIEHQLSAYYDITHGLGMAIILPKWMRYILDENTALIFKKLGVYVFGIDTELNNIIAAEKTIEYLENLFFSEFKLPSRLSKLNIDEQYFEKIANSITVYRDIEELKPLNKDDIYNILMMCL